MWLSHETFRTVLASTPLMSIDLVVRNSKGEILLGQHLNRPAQGYWFVPGGRILKNETLDAAFIRLTRVELGQAFERSQARLLDVYEHFYPDTVFGSDEIEMGTHYVELGYQLLLPDGHVLAQPHDQHGHYRWWNTTEDARWRRSSRQYTCLPDHALLVNELRIREMLYSVILAGGTGTRLWPLSRQLSPKQFLPLVDSKLSMLQTTIQRLPALDIALPLLICNEEHRFLAAEQLRQLNMEQAKILLEPVGRNTAPAIALAALQASDGAEDPILLVLAADHLIQDVPAFHASVQAALPLARAGKLVTFGIVPTHPETGYGYIEKGESVGDGFAVRRFVEKPNLATAAEYLACGDYFWNSGMFMFRASRYLEELERFQPAIVAACREALAGGAQDMHFTRVDAEAFAACPEDSIDYAVMERTSHAVTVPLDAGWSDIGSWSALWDIDSKDAGGNVFKGDVISERCQNSYVHASSRLVAAVGVDDLIIIETKDAVLISHKSQAQDVKKIVAQLKAEKRREYVNHREVYRPWGVYDSIDNGNRYQVKRITVTPGAKLSIQMHNHRAEHWIVVSGTAKVTNGDKTYLVTENQSTYIPVGQIHSLENPGVIPLELIEVQSGSYLGEDDIVRFEDKYGRV